VLALGGRLAAELASFVVKRELGGHDLLGLVIKAIAAKTNC
jgi:hypothetical protein